MGEIAYGLIETIRVREGRMPLLARHLARLERSRSALGFATPARDVAELLRPFAGMGDAVLRVELRGADVSVTVRELPPLDPPVVVTAAQPHVPYPHKTTERDAFDEALAEAEVAGADDALLVTSGEWVAEGTTWSVFWWDGEGLRTPGLELGVLPGIGRARVMELVRAEEGRFPRAVLAAKSVFLTNAVRGIVSLKSLDGEVVTGDARTAELAGRFWPVT